MPHLIVFPEPNRVELQRLDDNDLPAPATGQVRVRTRVTLLSTGTEGIIFGRRYAPETHWDRMFRWPHRPGYSCVAEVVDSGDTKLAVGTRVVGMMSHASDHVVRADRCTPVPDSVSDEDAAWFALAKVAYVGAEASGAGLGSRVLVVGAGPVGQMATRWLAVAGVGELTVIDRTGGMRLDRARAGGATAAVQHDLTEGPPPVDGGSEEQPPIVVDSTGNPEAFSAALAAVARFGRVVLLGDVGDPSRQRLSSDLITRGITVVGAHGNHISGERDHEVRRLFFRLVAAGRFGMSDLITHRFTPAECADAYDLTERSRNSTLGILFDWTGE